MQEKLAKIIQKITINCDKLSNLAPTHLETKIMYDYILYIYTEIAGCVWIQTCPIRSQILLDLYWSSRHNPQCFPSLFQHLSLSLKKTIHVSAVHSLNLLWGSPQTPRTLRKDPRHASRPKSPRRFSAKMSFTRLLQWIKTCRGKFWCLDSPM